MKPPRPIFGLPFALSLLVAAFGPLQAQDRVNPDALVLQDFANRIAGYMRLHAAVKAEVRPLKPTSSAAAILHHERHFEHKIREARRTASQGNIFTPEIAAEFRRLIGIAMQGQDATRVKQSLKH